MYSISDDLNVKSFLGNGIWRESVGLPRFSRIFKAPASCRIKSAHEVYCE